MLGDPGFKKLRLATKFTYKKRSANQMGCGGHGHI